MTRSFSAVIPQDHFISTGSTVRVIEGALDSYSGTDISNWCGRVLEVSPDEQVELALVQWDSLTLRAMPEEFIRTSLAEELNWAEFTVPVESLRQIEPRDTQLETDWQREKTNNRYLWNKAGAAGRRISAVTFKGELFKTDLLSIWTRHLENIVIFPFEASVQYPEELGPIHTGDLCKVISLAGFDEKMGIYCWIEINGRLFGLPAFDLEPTTCPSTSRKALADYQIWWANR